MKKKISALIAVIMTLTILSPSVLAANFDETSTDSEFVYTMGSAVYYTDENGNLVLDEEYSDLELVSATELNPSDVASPNLVTGIQKHTKLFGGLTATVQANFTYEPGYSVNCSFRFGSVDYLYSGWTLSKSSDLIVTKGSADQWCRVTYRTYVLTENQSSRIYDVWIECYRSGTITKS